MNRLRLLLFLLLAFSVQAKIARAQVNEEFDALFERAFAHWTSSVHQVKITHTYQDKHNGVRHHYGVQMYRDMPVIPAFFDLHSRKDEIVSAHQNFVQIDKLQGVMEGSLSADECLQAAALYLGIPQIGGSIIKHTSVNETNGNQVTWDIPSWSKRPIKGHKVWLWQDQKIIQVWLINWLTPENNHWYNLFVSGYDGTILDKQDLIISCQAHPGHAHEARSECMPGLTPNASLATPNTYAVFPIPVESPNHGSMSQVSNPADSMASPYGWHDVNGSKGHEYQITRGNNVFAMDDKDDDDAGGYSPDGGADLNFIAPFDNNKPASDFLDAAIINLFYMNNVMHDVWYHYGFDEQAGNFQQNNYGKGGLSGDFVMADAQDGGGNNNANFATPEDGDNPRMQMYLWTASAGSAKLLNVLPPSGAAGSYSGVQAGFGPQLTKTPITGRLVLVNSFLSGTEGCDSFSNYAALKNNIALIDRGTCTFVEKVQRAQAAGAKAVVIINNTSSAPFSMGGSNAGISIPSMMISQQIGITLKTAVNSGVVNVSLSDSSGIGQKILDSDFDNGIIAHEYGHGISVRLTGGAMNSSCLNNQEQMGEGWSDFFSLVMTHEPNDQGADSRGIGNYVIAESVNGGGIRTYPYSTNKAISPYTYDDIKSLSVPHGVGSVWCSMLWDMYWALIDKYGYDSDIYRGTGGNNLAMQLVIDGLKLQPCNPGFEDGRDAILLADQLNNKGANQLLIWQVFAGRGLGYDADQGSTSSRSDGKEGYQIPPFVMNSLTVSKSAEGEVLQGDTLEYLVKVKNLTANVLKKITFNDTLSNDVTFHASIGCNIQFNTGVLSMNLDSMLPGDSLACRYSVIVNTPKYTQNLFTEEFEGISANWKTQRDLGTDSFKISQVRKRGGNNSLFITNPPTQSDQSAIFTFNLDTLENPALNIYHYFNTEDQWDGAVIEVSIKNQNNWVDAQDMFLIGGYNDNISVNPQSRISGQPAFTGNSNGFVQSLLDLSGYRGNSIDVRLRFVSDGAASAEGWYIDDVSLMELSLISNVVYLNTAAGVVSSAEAKTMVQKNELTTSIQASNARGIKVFPNPVNETLHLEFDDASNRQILMYDARGRLIESFHTTAGSERIAMQNLARGMYLILVKANSSTIQYKVIKN